MLGCDLFLVWTSILRSGGIFAQVEGDVKISCWVTIDVLESGQINIINGGGGTLDMETFAIMQDGLELKTKHEKRRVVPEAIYDPTTGEEPDRMN